VILNVKACLKSQNNTTTKAYVETFEIAPNNPVAEAFIPFVKL